MHSIPKIFFGLLAILLFAMAGVLAIVIIMGIPMFMLFGAFCLMVEWLVTKIFGPIVFRMTDQLSYSKSEESKEEQRGRLRSGASIEMPISVLRERERLGRKR